MDANTRIIDMTAGELLKYLQSELGTATKGKRFVYGYKGVAELFNCSKPTASKLIHGKIKAAVCQHGRKIVVDADRALKLFNS